MSFNKHLMTLILLMIFLILSNVIYASDTENTTLTEQTTNDDIEISNVNSYNKLRTTITKIKKSNTTNHEINLKQDTYKLTNIFTSDLYSETPHNIKINGNHSIIDGQNKYSFIKIPLNANVTINNLTIRNTKSDFGAAIKSSGNLILENVNFENNYANYPTNILGGGALFIEESTNITNCTFKNNGGEIEGSAIFIKESKERNTITNIKNCIFQNNTTPNGSTIKILGQTITSIHNSSFTQENCENSIITNTLSKLNITNCSFTNLNSSNIITNDYECNINNILIYNNNINTTILTNHEMLLNNSKIYNNTVKNLLKYVKNVTIENTIIEDNKINDLIISNNTEENNKDQSLLKVKNITIQDNIANQTCGIKNEYNDSKIFILDSIFKNNTSLSDEGILYDFKGNMYVENNKFINNTSDDLFKGSMDSFNRVKSNEYKGNYLRTYFKTDATIENNNLIINGSLNTDEIYNTTIKIGKLYLKQNNTLITEETVVNNTFILELPYNDELCNLTLYYDGLTDFRNDLKNVIVPSLEEKYSVEITNISKTLAYGDYVGLNLEIRNTGDIIVNNIELMNVLPNELIYINSSEYFDKENNIFKLNSLDVNENRSIEFILRPKKYDDLNLEFNILDNKTDATYTFNHKITFIKPIVRINTFVAHPGEVINITGTLHNYNKDTVNDIKLYFNYKQLNSFSYTLTDNQLSIENIKLSESLTKKKYLVEIVCNDKDVEEFSNTTLVSVIKYDTYSNVSYNISNSYLNLTVKLFDETDNLVNSGSVAVKVNGKTVKTLKVNNGIVVLENYKLISNYDNEYNISLTFTGNNKYNLHFNNICVKEAKKSIDFIINYNISDKLVLSVNVINNENILPDDGFVAIKINDKTILPQMSIQEYFNIEYNIDLLDITNITVSYYGNENFLVSSKTISV